MSQFSFNLTSDPWIPCVQTAGGLRELSLEALLVHAHELVEVAGDTPLETVSLHRLLVAVLHRCFGPANARSWGSLYRAGRFESAAVSGYLDQWHHRFDLFDEQYPFYQTPGLPEAKSGSIAKLLFQADNNPTLFDHAVAARPPATAPAKVARLLVAIQGFDTTGTKTSDEGQQSAQAGLLVQCAVALQRGNTLFETLMLNLHRYSPEAGEPWEFDAVADRPCWERDGPTRAVERPPDGYCDLLTWQSRRALAFPEGLSDAERTVRKVVLMPGYKLSRQLERHDYETMVAYLKRRKPHPTESAYYPLGFHQDRAVWRDSLALFATSGGSSQPPKMSRWVVALQDEGELPADLTVRVDVAGLAADKAKCLFWRHERAQMPASIMRDPHLMECVREALDVAESAARIVGASDVYIDIGGKRVGRRSPLRVAAEVLVHGKHDVTTVVQQLDARRVFWGRLEHAFSVLLDELPSDVTRDDHGNTYWGRTALEGWRAALRVALDEAFDAVVRRLGASASGLEAAARAERVFHDLKREVVGTAVAPVTVEEEA